MSIMAIKSEMLWFADRFGLDIITRPRYTLKFWLWFADRFGLDIIERLTAIALFTLWFADRFGLDIIFGNVMPLLMSCGLPTGLD